MTSPADVSVTWLGHAAFLLTSGTTTVLIDPFLTGNPTATAGPDDVSPTVILVTHAHNDHLGDAVGISTRTGAPIISTHEIAVWAGWQGAQTIGANIGGTVEFDGGSAKFVPAVHSSAYDNDGEFVAVGTAAGFVVRLAGRTVYFAGDTSLFGDMALIGAENLDLAVIPIGGHYTMDAADAVKATALLSPRVVIPCHFNTFPPIEADGRQFANDVYQQTGIQGIVLAPGESHQLA